MCSTFTIDPFMRLTSIALELQEHCFGRAGALTWRCRSITLEAQEHYSGGSEALLWRCGSITLESSEQDFGRRKMMMTCHSVRNCYADRRRRFWHDTSRLCFKILAFSGLRKF